MNFLKRIFNRSNYFDVSNVRGVDLSSSKGLNLQTASGIYNAYNLNPIFNAIINKASFIFSKLFYKDYENLKSTLLSPFTHPLNCSGELFLKEFAKQLLLYDHCIVYKKDKLRGVFSENSKIAILDFKFCEFEFDKNSTDFNPLNRLLKIHYDDGSIRQTFLKSEFEIASKNIFSEDINFSVSSVETDLNIIYKALQVREKYNTKTRFGMITPDSTRFSNISERISSTLKDEVLAVEQKRLDNYSAAIGKHDLIISPQAMKFIDLMPNISTMGLEESTLNSTLRVCAVLNFPPSSLITISETKFSNKEYANKDIYTDLIIPLWNLYENFINQTLYQFDEYQIVIDFENIEALQKDKKTLFETNNMLTTTVLTLNKQIKEGIISKDIALSMLLNLYDIEFELANELLM